MLPEGYTLRKPTLKLSRTCDDEGKQLGQDPAHGSTRLGSQCDWLGAEIWSYCEEAQWVKPQSWVVRPTHVGTHPVSFVRGSSNVAIRRGLIL